MIKLFEIQRKQAMVDEVKRKKAEKKRAYLESLKNGPPPYDWVVPDMEDRVMPYLFEQDKRAPREVTEIFEENRF